MLQFLIRLFLFFSRKFPHVLRFHIMVCCILLGKKQMYIGCRVGAMICMVFSRCKLFSIRYTYKDAFFWDKSGYFYPGSGITEYTEYQFLKQRNSAYSHSSENLPKRTQFLLGLVKTSLFEEDPLCLG